MPASHAGMHGRDHTNHAMHAARLVTHTRTTRPHPRWGCRRYQLPGVLGGAPSATCDHGERAHRPTALTGRRGRCIASLPHSTRSIPHTCSLRSCNPPTGPAEFPAPPCTTEPPLDTASWGGGRVVGGGGRGKGAGRHHHPQNTGAAAVVYCAVLCCAVRKLVKNNRPSSSGSRSRCTFLTARRFFWKASCVLMHREHSAGRVPRGHPGAGPLCAGRAPDPGGNHARMRRRRPPRPPAAPHAMYRLAAKMMSRLMRREASSNWS